MTTQHKTRFTKWNVSAKKDFSYSIVEYPNLFSSKDSNLFGESVEEEKPRRIIFVDKNIKRLYASKIYSYFRKNKITIKVVSLEVSEQYKTSEMLLALLKELDNFKLLRRKEPVIAIGGGVLLDVVGLAASLYRRGVPYIRVPTTLMGIIDAGIGVKTGINFNGHKNRIGTYYPSLISYADTTFLATLESRHISNGLAEMLKIGLIKDASLFDLLERYGETLLTQKLQNMDIAKVILDKAIKGMIEELEPNLWESDLERLVDFGHTFSGALEMKALPHLLHGETVSIDMAFVSVLAYQRKLITEQELLRIFSAMRSMQLPIFHPLCETDMLYDALLDTSSHRDGLQRFPIPVGIGRAKFINDINYEEIELASLSLKILSKKFT